MDVLSVTNWCQTWIFHCLNYRKLRRLFDQALSRQKALIINIYCICVCHLHAYAQVKIRMFSCHAISGRAEAQRLNWALSTVSKTNFNLSYQPLTAERKNIGQTRMFGLWGIFLARYSLLCRSLKRGEKVACQQIFFLYSGKGHWLNFFRGSSTRLFVNFKFSKLGSGWDLREACSMPKISKVFHISQISRFYWKCVQSKVSKFCML